MKRIPFILFALLLLFGSAACSRTDTATPAPPTETAASPSTSPAAAPESGADEETAVSTPLEAPTTEPTVDSRPTLTPPPPPGVDTAAEPAASQPETRDVNIAAGDGLELQGTLATPGGLAPFPGVLLLHMLNSERAVWQEVGLVDGLLRSGYAVLTLDMRGHGDTGGARDWALAADDLQRVVDYLAAQPAVDETRIAVIGASIGANMAFTTAAARSDVQTAVLLSPGLDYRGVTTEDKLAEYGERPLLIVASEEDSYAADSSRTLAEQAAAAQLELYTGAGHGTNMFAQETGLIDLLLNWLQQSL